MLEVSWPPNWDEYGSQVRLGPGRTGNARYVDLRPLVSRVVWQYFPAGLHFYFGEDGSSIISTAFICKSVRCRGYLGADAALASYPGINYLMYIQDISDAATGPDAWLIRFGNIRPGEMTDRSLIEPMMVTEILAGLQRRPKQYTSDLDPTHYPHRCPHCGGPAYVGFNQIDCARGCQ